MDDKFVLVEPSLSDADYEDIWRALWDSEDDIVFSLAFSVEEHLYSSDFDISELDGSFAYGADGVSVYSSDFDISELDESFAYGADGVSVDTSNPRICSVLQPSFRRPCFCVSFCAWPLTSSRLSWETHLISGSLFFFSGFVLAA
ncbi:unnamed protein product [Calypogeia fissa]